MPDSPGRPPEVTEAEILACFREATDPVLTTAEVAARLPIKQRMTLNYLESLAEAGLLRSKPAGQALVWWLPGETATDPDESDAAEKRGADPNH